MNIKKLIIKVKWFPSQLFNKSVLNIKEIRYGKNFITYGRLFVRGTGKIEIGNDVVINSCRETNPIGGDCKTILYAKDQGHIVIGNHVGMSNVSIVAENEVVIEDNVYIGGNCKIYDNDFHPINYEQRMKTPNDHITSKPVLIQEGAFIGAHSIILKGVSIGRRSVIGAGSVVTKNVPDDEIWAGNPAHLIKRL